jgi:TolB-like protein/AraC-like DNA-binding protein/Tfp pilus assembly protein PilF
MNQTLSMDQVFLNKVTAIIEANLENEKFGAADLSHELGMSRSNINRRLRSLQKTSISQLIQEIRLQRAMEMLQQKVATASEVAFRVGFSSPTYFNKCFHEYYGFPPGEVKKLEEYDRERAKHLITSVAIGSKSVPIKTKKEWSTRKKLILRVSLIALFFIGIFFVLYYFYDTMVQRSGEANYFSIRETERSIAILPFKNISNDPSQDWFSDGITGEILNHLFQIGGLKVPSSSSTARFRESKLSIRQIARELNVSYVLVGSVSRSNDQIRVNAELVNGKTEVVIWSEDYMRGITVADILDIQSDIALQVADNLKMVIKPAVKNRIKARPTENTEAYTLYQQADYSESYQRGMQMLEKAVILDPDFGDAYAKMADWRMFYDGDSMSREQMVEKVEALLKKALQLDKNSILAHSVYAELRMWFFWDPETVEKELRIFRQLSPSNTDNFDSFIQCLWNLERFHEAHNLCKDYFNRDETSSTKWCFLALSYHYIGEEEKASETIETALRLFRNDQTVYEKALEIYTETAQYEKATALFEKNSKGMEINKLNERNIMHAAISYFKTGYKNEASVLLKELLSKNKNLDISDTYIFIAQVYVATVEYEKAIHYLEKAYSIREPGLIIISWHPAFQPLQGDPRFKDLLQKIAFK